MSPASVQISWILGASWRVFPEASRPSDWKHVATHPLSLRRQVATVFSQS
jgi:hypothetical protein